MTTSTQRPARTSLTGKRPYLAQLLPVLQWGRTYRRRDLFPDLLAGLIVAIMLVPQGMAYALLAGLPPQVGLYASMVPLIIYGLLGTSRVLAVGPVAIVSLLVASAIAPIAEATGASVIQIALTLALLVGLIQAVMGLIRLGFLVNFMSHPVLAGFTSAAAFLIGSSQLKHLLGISIPRLDFFELLWYALTHLQETNLVTAGIGAGSMAALFYAKFWLSDHLQRLGLRASVALPLTKVVPLLVVLLGTLLVWGLRLDSQSGVSVVGQVPMGLPGLTLPSFDLSLWQALLPAALTISFVGYMESIAVAKSLASKRQQKVDSNQELVALGLANLGATFTGGYPVTGGLSRSVVNFEAGARSGLASITTAVLIALTLLFLTPLFYFLPNVALAAIVIVAVTGLVDVKTFRHVWRFNKGDAASFGVTFTAVLALGVEIGILVGVASALLLLVWRTSHPHVAVVGRLGNSETYRNILRHPVQTWPHIIAIRIDESLYFSNSKFLEETVLGLVQEQPEAEHFILIGTAINFIDASALETLESINQQLKDAQITLHFAAIKGPVMDKLHKIGFVEHIGANQFHLSMHDAIKSLGCLAHEEQ